MRDQAYHNVVNDLIEQINIDDDGDDFPEDILNRVDVVLRNWDESKFVFRKSADYLLDSIRDSSYEFSPEIEERVYLVYCGRNQDAYV